MTAPGESSVVQPKTTATIFSTVIPPHNCGNDRNGGGISHGKGAKPKAASTEIVIQPHTTTSMMRKNI